MVESEPGYVVIIPSYNTGPRLRATVEDALRAWPDVRVVIDGSTDGSAETLEPLARIFRNLKIIRKSENQGKGAAVLDAAREAQEAGYTHAVVMDADGQHPATSIQPMIEASRAAPDVLLMGAPVFGPEVPKVRLYGRRLTLFWTDLETLWCGLGDTLFGMRIYPLKPLIRAMESTRFARGYDFDPEVAVRMVWEGVRPVQFPVPVRYFSTQEGGISHFHYLRDNVKLTFLQFRMMFAFLRYGGRKVRRAKKEWNHPS